MEIWNKYQKTNIAEMRPVTENDILHYKAGDTIPPSFQWDISISSEDLKNGSPKIGDMISRNPANHNDVWLVEKKYFDENFKAI